MAERSRIDLVPVSAVEHALDASTGIAYRFHVQRFRKMFSAGLNMAIVAPRVGMHPGLDYDYVLGSPAFHPTLSDNHGLPVIGRTVNLERP